MKNKIYNFCKVTLKHPAAGGLWLFFITTLVLFGVIIFKDIAGLIGCILNSRSVSPTFQIFIIHLVEIMIFILLEKIVLLKMESHPKLCESFESVGDAFTNIFSKKEQDKLTNNVEDEKKDVNMELTLTDKMSVKSNDKNKKKKNKKRKNKKRK